MGPKEKLFPESISIQIIFHPVKLIFTISHKNENEKFILSRIFFANINSAFIWFRFCYSNPCYQKAARRKSKKSFWGFLCVFALKIANKKQFQKNIQLKISSFKNCSISIYELTLLACSILIHCINNFNSILLLYGQEWKMNAGILVNAHQRRR